MSHINLSIDQIVVKGFDPGDHKALIEGMKSELSRILADPSTREEWARSHRTPVLRLGRMPLASGLSGARRFGGGVARAIGKGMKP
jgi:hypothetical protein